MKNIRFLYSQLSKKIIGVLVFAMTLSVSSFAQAIIKEDTLQCSIYFRQSKWNFDPNYRDNAKRLSEFVEKVYFREGDPSMSIKKIVVNSGASPEGPNDFNYFLSDERAAAIINFLVRETNIDESQIIINSPGVDWTTLTDLVRRRSDVPEKAAVIEILTSDEYGDNNILRRSKLELLSGGGPYKWLYDNLFPLDRHSRVKIAYVSRFKEEMMLPKDVGFSYKPEFVAPESDITRHILPDKIRNFYRERDTLTFAIKTNLLYDAVTALNIEAELPIKNHWSVAVEYVFPWWETGNKYCLQMLELGVEGRYWFRNNEYHSQKLQGHFLGAYAMSSMFDFQYDYSPAYQGEYWSTGLTYGYAFPISKTFHLELSVSAGYLSSAYRHYYHADDYSLLWRDKYKVGRISYFGPTKLKVSFVWPIHISYNKREKGR